MDYMIILFISGVVLLIINEINKVLIRQSDDKVRIMTISKAETFDQAVLFYRTDYKVVEKKETAAEKKIDKELKVAQKGKVSEEEKWINY